MSEDSNGYQGKELVALGALLERERLAGQLGMSFNGDRDMYETLGYSETLTFAQYAAEYARGDIAGRVVDLPATETWRDAPKIIDGESADDHTPFLDAFQALVDRLHIWHYLDRVDRLAGIGRFGVLLLGVRDNLTLREPLKAGGLRKPDDLLYLSAFSEGSTTILTFDKDPQSMRFGLPDTYQIQMGDKALGFGTEVVHWSRLLHVADDLTEDEVYGRPRLERVFNRLQDLMKVVGGGAEAAWRVMDRGLHADVRDGFNLADPEAVSDEIEEYIHGLRRFIRTQGMTITPLGADMVDPSGLFGIIISLIAAAANIPQRILIGSERGELASSQDATQWAGQIRSRRTKFAEPMILRAFIDRLVWAGALPEPSGGTYDVKWKPLFELDDTQKAQVAGAYASAIAAYATGGAPTDVVPVKEFRREYLGLAEEPDPDDLPSAEEQAKADAEQAAQAEAAKAAAPQSKTPAAQPEAEAQPAQPEQPPATNEADMLAAVTAEYSRAADILRDVVVNYNPYHAPSGTREGGRFTSGPSGGRDVPDSGMIQRGELSMIQRTLNEQGGFTYQPQFNTAPADGYMLSPYEDREKVLALADFSTRALSRFIRENRDLLVKDDHYLGGWVDEDKVYLDVSIRRKNAQEAAKLAREHKQLAYFDLGKMETVYVN